MELERTPRGAPRPETPTDSDAQRPAEAASSLRPSAREALPAGLRLASPLPRGGSSTVGRADLGWGACGGWVGCPRPEEPCEDAHVGATLLGPSHQGLGSGSAEGRGP